LSAWPVLASHPIILTSLASCRRWAVATFLAEVNADKDLLRFSKTFGEREYLSQSRAMGLRSIPEPELEALELAIKEMQQLGDDKNRSPEVLELLREFRLPNPDVDFEFYRLSGNDLFQPRLFIVWGCESIHGSSLSPQEALEKLRQRVFPDWLRWLYRFLAIGTLILLVLLLRFALSALWPTNPYPPSLPPTSKLTAPSTPSGTSPTVGSNIWTC